MAVESSHDDNGGRDPSQDGALLLSSEVQRE